MSTKPSDGDQYSHEETERRVQRALKGAFNRNALPLKAVPRKPRASRTKRASANAPKRA